MLADAVARLVLDKFGDLTDNFSSPHARRKVLAGVVMTTGTIRGYLGPPPSGVKQTRAGQHLSTPSAQLGFCQPRLSHCSTAPAGTDVKDAKVISVSTGTKCINGEYMSDRGLALNDCHAEIISRRSLLRFLYAQLELALRCGTAPALPPHARPAGKGTRRRGPVSTLWGRPALSILWHRPPGLRVWAGMAGPLTGHVPPGSSREDQKKSIFQHSERGGFRLKDTVQFHLYISTSPCGDARIFSPHEPILEGMAARCCPRLPAARGGEAAAQPLGKCSVSVIQGRSSMNCAAGGTWRHSSGPARGLLWLFI